MDDAELLLEECFWDIFEDFDSGVSVESGLCSSTEAHVSSSVQQPEQFGGNASSHKICKQRKAGLLNKKERGEWTMCIIIIRFNAHRLQGYGC